jgi:hypothetical protein
MYSESLFDRLTVKNDLKMTMSPTTAAEYKRKLDIACGRAKADEFGEGFWQL